MAVLAFGEAMIPQQWKSGLAVIELERVPGVLIMALGAVGYPELIEVRIDMTFHAQPAGPFIDSLLEMTILAEQVVMYALQFQSRFLFVIELPGLPVERCVTTVAGSLELAFMIILVTVAAFFLVDLIFFLLVAFLAFRILVFPDQRELGLLVMIE